MGFVSWLKSFTFLETVLSILIILLITTAIILPYLKWEDDLEDYDDIHIPTKPAFETSDVDSTYLKDDSNSKNLSNFVYVPEILKTLQDTVLNIVPEYIKEEYRKQQIKITDLTLSMPMNTIITDFYYSFMAAIIDLKNLKHETCSAVIVSGRWAITTASCAVRIDDLNNYELVPTTGLNKKSLSYKLSKIIVHQKYTEGSEYFDVALLKSDKEFELDHECYARLLSPLASVAMKVGDAVILVSWDFKKIISKEGKEKIDRFIYAIPTFINNQNGILNWCNQSNQNKIKDITSKLDTCVLNQDPKLVGAPIFKGHAAYALISKNGKLVILAHHLDWFVAVMS